MTSSRLILIFLGFIFFIIVVLSSNRIASFLRSKFGSLIPPLKPTTEEITPTPILGGVTPTPTPTPTSTVGNSRRNSSGAKGGQVDTIPATGPAEVAWLLVGGSFLIGVSFKKFSS